MYPNLFLYVIGNFIVHFSKVEYKKFLVCFGDVFTVLVILKLNL